METGTNKGMKRNRKMCKAVKKIIDMEEAATREEEGWDDGDLEERVEQEAKGRKEGTWGGRS